MKNSLAIAPDQVENAITILNQFKEDPKAQECLAIYRRLPEERKEILLIAMDAFVMGAETEAKIARRKQEDGK